MIRSVAARVKHIRDSPFFDLDKTLAPYRDRDDFPLLDLMTRAAMTPATTSNADWMEVVTHVVISEWNSNLAVASAFAQLRAKALSLNSPSGAVLKVPSRSSSPQINGSFVGETQPIPARRFGLTSTTLLPHKLGCFSEFSREITQQSPLNIKQILKAEIVADNALAIDTILIDATAADTIRPVGLRNGVSGLTPSAAVNHYERISADVRALTASGQPCARVAFVCNTTQAVPLQLALSAKHLTGMRQQRVSDFGEAAGEYLSLMRV